MQEPAGKAGWEVAEETRHVLRGLAVAPRPTDGQGAETGGFFSDQPSADIRSGAQST